MARLKTNILDGGTGTVGSVVLYQWRGIPCMRSKPDSYKDKKSVAQLRQRQKMTLVHRFLRCFVHYLSDTFYEKDARRSPYQAAQSYNLKYGISGDYPNQFIDLRKALIAKGELPLPENFTAERKSDQIIVTWDVDYHLDFNLQNDELLLFWSKTEGATYARLVSTKAKRSEGKYILDLSSFKIQYEINVWGVFINRNRKEVSNSLLLR
ncbi:hypothetical protein E9993_00280 [Labilibacter sediminis]|nr:hypothetical protein E9993_00280 [Labilibacter sediminis]